MLNKIMNHKLLWDVLSVLAGCILSAFAINYILVPNNLATTGLTGISIMIQKFSGINYTYIYYAFSMFILMAAWFILGKASVLKIIFASICYSTTLLIMGSIKYDFIEGDMFLVCIYFSLIYGVGTGLVMRRGIGFGGMDTLAKMLQKKIFKLVSVSRVMLFIDALVILALGLVFGRNVALYALVNHVMYIYVLDYVLFGFRSKLYKVSIITHRAEVINGVSKYIFKEIGRGVTIHDVVGAYTNENKKMLTSICSPRESAMIRLYLAQHHPQVFMEVSPIVSVYAIGRRFIKIDDVD